MRLWLGAVIGLLLLGFLLGSAFLRRSASRTPAGWSQETDLPSLQPLSPTQNCLLHAYPGRWLNRTSLSPLLRAMEAVPQRSWDSNCTASLRRLGLYWKPDACTLADPFILPPKQRTQPLTNLRFLFVGDSLVAQFYASFRVLFPNYEKNKLLEIAMHGQTLTRFVDRSANTTLDLLVQYQLGRRFLATLDLFFSSASYDGVILNSGIWYNLHSPDPEQLAHIREGRAIGWAPLGKDEYRIDLVELARYLLQRRAQRSTPRVFWLQSTPQHFSLGTFEWTDLGFHRTCSAYRNAEVAATANWRNDVAEPILRTTGVTVVRTFPALSLLHYSHPWHDGGFDCTHFCNPGLAFVHTATMLWNHLADAWGSIPSPSEPTH